MKTTKEAPTGQLPELPDATTIMDLDLCEHSVFYSPDMLYYGDQRAAHARELALSEASKLCSDETEDVPLELMAAAIEALKRGK